MNHTIFKIALVGCGGMVMSSHGPALAAYAARHPAVVLCACCDTDSEKAETVRRTFGFQRMYTQMKAMLEKERPDAVCLVVPVRATAVLAEEIMGMGFPLILEKPPGATSEETRQLIRAAEQAGCPNRVAFNRRYMPLSEKAVSLMQNIGRPEDLRHLHCSFLRDDRFDPDFSTTAIHGIDLTRQLMRSDFRQVRFEYQYLNNFGEGVKNIRMYATMMSGATATLEFCPVSGCVAERYTLYADQHLVTYKAFVPGGTDGNGSLTWHHRNLLRFQETPEQGEGGFYEENASFFDALRKEVPVTGDIRSALQSVEVAAAVRQEKTFWADSDTEPKN